jgi:hypothetical protein
MESKLVICMKWGARYSADYVNRLYQSCHRHIDQPIQFVCFTDDPSSLSGDIAARPLPQFADLPAELAATPWRKLSLWQRGLGEDLIGRDALVLDLDIIVTGSLDAFWSYAPGKYVVIENWTKPGRGIGNTSVFRFEVGKYPHIYDDFLRDPARMCREHRIEQEYISQRIGAANQAFWPKRWCRSFKEELLPAWPLRLWKVAQLPADARIIVFHGKPDPHEAMEGRWPVKVWWKKFYKALQPVPWIHEHWR